MSNFIITNSPTQKQFGVRKISLDEVVDKITSAGVKSLAVDVETTGLSAIDDELLMLQISTKRNTFIIDARGMDLSPLKSLFESSVITKVAHNAKFDVGFLKANGLPIENIYCTMVVDKIIHCGKDGFKFSLADLLERYKGLEMDKTTRNTFIGHKGDFTEEQIIYGAEDTRYLLDIARQQMEEVNRLKLLNVVKLENHALLSFSDMELEGMYVNPDKWLAVAEKSKQEVADALEALSKQVVKDFPKLIDLNLLGEPVMNWNSPLQVLRIFKHIDPTLEGVGAPVIEPIVHKHDILRMYLDYKGSTKKANAYGEKFLDLRHGDGKLHTHYSQILNTGRVSSSKPNLQQIPSSEDFRNCFEPGREGWVLVGADFASQELAIIASASGEEEWLKILAAGGDLHSRCAELVFGEEFTKLDLESSERKKLRTFTKTITFGISYGMGALSLSKRLKITELEAEKLIDKYFTAFPRVKGFLENSSNIGEDTGLITTLPPFRRLRSFTHWNGVNTPKREKSFIRRASANTVIQGSAADQTKLALIHVRNAIKETPIKMVLTVHDEILLTCPKELSEEASKILEECMAKAGDSNLQKGLLTAGASVMECWQK